MGTVTKYGREFEFDEDVPPDVQEKRILNWMQQNAKDELETEAPKAAKPGHNPKLATAVQALMMGNPLGMAANLFAPEAVRNRVGDTNFYRTLAQGALPAADEALAGVRSLFGDDYGTALSEERQGVKDYSDKVGPFEAGLTEMLGAVGAIPFGGAAVQGAAKLPVLGRGVQAMTRKAAASPWTAALLGGAATGAGAGFAAEEDDFTTRAGGAARFGALGAALGPLGYGAVRAAKGVGDLAKTDNAVANFLRSQIGNERKMLPNSPDFTRDAMQGLRRDMRQNQYLDTDPMAADLLPRTAEAVFQKSGPDVANLADNVLQRQHNRRIAPGLAKDTGQYGRVGDAMDMAWGPDMFKRADADIIAQRKAAADQMFEPAYRMNIRGSNIDNALENPYVRAAWPEALRFAAAERRAPGPTDATGNLRAYNTEFLHDLKKSMDDMIESAMKTDGGANKARIIRKSKNRLNRAIMDNNEPYKLAMQRYGDDSARLDALRKGREEVFVPGSVDKTGAMDADAIKAYLANPNIPQEHKDLFQTGAARALRELTLGSGSKKFSHNWADFINNPKGADSMEALLGNKINALSHGPTLNAWTLFQKKMAKESENYKNLISTGLGNSRTSVREAMKRELEGGDFNPGAVISAFVNPTAPSTWRESGRILLDKVDRTNAKVNKVADILGRKGKAGNKSSLDEIESLLRSYDRRRSDYSKLGAYAPYLAAYGYPAREQ